MSGQTASTSATGLSTGTIIFGVVVVVALVSILVLMIVLVATNTAARVNFFTTQQAKLIPTGYIGAVPNFGQSVALSEDGNTLAVGTTGNDNNIGAVIVFVRDSITKEWSQQQILTTTETLSPGDRFGHSLSISADGNSLVAGRRNALGGVWAFERVGTVWTQNGAMIMPDDLVTPLLSSFGANDSSPGSDALQISADGTVFVAGAITDVPTGASYVYEKVSGVWTKNKESLVQHLWVLLDKGLRLRFPKTKT